MPRLVQHNAQGPVKVEPNEDGSPAWICQCGLSKNQPYCDGSHAVTTDEDPSKLYQYDRQQERQELEQAPQVEGVDS